MTALLHDLRFAVRTLRRRPLFAAVALATIALGIGAATSIYSIVDGVLLRPLPFREPGRLVAVWQTYPAWRTEPILAPMWNRIALSLPEYRDLRDKATSFSHVGVWNGSRLRLVEGDRADLVMTAGASAGLLAVLGERPFLGRAFLPADDLPNAAPVAMVSWEEWRSRYGGAPDILGRRVTFDETVYTIVGVLPRGLTIGRVDTRETGIPAYWTPVSQTWPRDYDQRSNHSFRAVARLKPGVTIERAEQEARAILRDPERGDKEGTRLAEWQADQTREARGPLLVLLGAVGLLLLIACANVATLLLGEAVSRELEMAARLALGASRGRLVRQLLTESVVLAAAGGILGAALAWGGTRALVALAPPRLPGLADVGLDARVLGAATLAVVLTGVLFGLVPALTLSRTGPGALLRGGAGQSARGRGALQRTMIAAELALSVVLLIGAGLLARSFGEITRVDPGFRRDGLLLVSTSMPRAMSRDSLRARQVFEDAVARLRAMPGVVAATQGTTPPFSGGSSSSTMAVEGETGATPGAGPPPREAVRHEAQQRSVAPGWFAMLGIPVLAGREFGAEDRGGAPDVAIVSEALARRNFPNGSPIGRRVWFQGAWRTIVGVVGDVYTQKLTRDVEATIYTPMAQRSVGGRWLVLRTAGSPAALAPMVRRVLAEVDPRITIAQASTMDELIRRSFAEERYRAALVSLFGVLAMLLSAVGTYGVTARAVARRSKETGIRLALGATEWAVVRQLVGHTLAGVGLGVLVGVAGAAAAARALAPFLFGVEATDPATYAAILSVLAAVSVAASWLPARRAGRVELARVLRAE